MKMKPEHFKTIRYSFKMAVELNPVFIAKLQTTTLSAERIRWTIFHFFVTDPNWDFPAAVSMNELYDYLNDNHIDTALRRIAGELLT